MIDLQGTFVATYTFQLATGRSRSEVREIIRRIPGYVSGRVPDQHGIGRAYSLGFVQSMFKSIHTGFLQKSAGRTDDLGDKWADLKPSTIAQKLAKIRRHGPKSRRVAKQLTPTQRRVYEQVYASTFQRLKKTKGEKLAKQAARKAAARAAGGVPKKLTGLGRAGQVPILIDTSRLEASLRPGTLTATSYSTPTPDQYVSLSRTRIELGTKVPYAHFHQTGTKKMKARPLWPSIQKMRPWTGRAANEATQSVVRILRGML